MPPRPRTSIDEVTQKLLKTATEPRRQTPENVTQLWKEVSTAAIAAAEPDDKKSLMSFSEAAARATAVTATFAVTPKSVAALWKGVGDVLTACGSHCQRCFHNRRMAEAFHASVKHAATAAAAEHLWRALSLVLTHGPGPLGTFSETCSFQTLILKTRTPEGVRWMWCAVSRSVPTKSSGWFATRDYRNRIVNAVVTTAPFATTEESTQCLWNAVQSVVVSVGDPAKDDFGVQPIVDAIVASARYATSARAVQYLWGSVADIAFSRTLETKRLFTSDAVIGAFEVSAAYAVESLAVQMMWLAVANITCLDNVPGIKPCFARAEIRRAAKMTAPYATSTSAVRWLWSAIQNICLTSADPVKESFATMDILEAFASSFPRAEKDSETIYRLWGAVAEITSTHDERPKAMFASWIIVNALEKTAPYAVSPTAVRYVWNSVANIARSHDTAIKDLFAVQSICDALDASAKAESSEVGAHWRWTAIREICSSENPATKAFFAARLSTQFHTVAHYQHWRGALPLSMVQTVWETVADMLQLSNNDIAASMWAGAVAQEALLRSGQSLVSNSGSPAAKVVWKATVAFASGLWYL